ncbi:protein of unknown function (plasmid) [Shinella sp. WSC3-e]|nr:hypothetical protein SHINE37_110271 [Rhizobiaceae bacterium]CAK7260718.1 protein of unknown function [Shinella sp. WSC3-e]
MTKHRFRRLTFAVINAADEAAVEMPTWRMKQTNRRRSVSSCRRMIRWSSGKYGVFCRCPASWSIPAASRWCGTWRRRSLAAMAEALPRTVNCRCRRAATGKPVAARNPALAWDALRKAGRNAPSPVLAVFGRHSGKSTSQSEGSP